MNRVCEHTNTNDLHLCLSPECKEPEKLMCISCFHNHDLLILKKFKFVEEQIKPILNILQKKESLAKSIRSRFEIKRTHAIQAINQEQSATLHKLESILKHQDFDPIVQVSQGKLADANTLVRLFNPNGQLKMQIFSTAQDDLLQFQEKLTKHLNGEREIKRVAVEQLQTEVKPMVKKIKNTENLEINTPYVTHNLATPSKESQVIEALMAIDESSVSVVEEQVQIVDDPKITKPEPPSTIECGSFDEAIEQIQLHKKDKLLNIYINFKKNEPILNGNTNNPNHYRKNIATFIDSILKLQHVEHLVLSIEKECELALWNLKKIDQKFSMLPALKVFDFTFYIGKSDAEDYDFNRLRAKIQSNLFISPRRSKNWVS